jgi:RNA-binding protein
MALTTKQRQFLRALAHHRKPVVQVGDAGVTDGVLQKVHDELTTHELIKVKIGKEAPVSLADAAAAIAAATGAEVPQLIGRTAVLFRNRKKKPGIRLPPADGAPAAAPLVAVDLDEDDE